MFYKLLIFVTCFHFLNIVFTVKAAVYKLPDGTNIDKKTIGENEVLLTVKKRSVLFSQAYLKTSMNITGWNILEVQSNEHNDDENQAYYGGLAEGCISAQLIYQHWYNTKKDICSQLRPGSCQKVIDYVLKNDKWVQNEIIKRKHKESYWWQVNLNYLQIDGLMRGYNLCRTNGTVELSRLEFLLLNMDGDLEDLEEKFRLPGSLPKKVLEEGRCSAVIKLLPHYEDLYVSHATWVTYNYMTRMLKNYILKYKIDSHSKTVIPGGTITFSGFPGTLNSVDDFYTISSNIVVQETTIGNSNDKLWQYVVPVGAVPESIRIMIANRLATDGKSWVDIFKKFNSGTYNNQWMVIDYNKFTPFEMPQEGLLWVLEQIPNFIEASDLTSVLVKQTYWPSYNIPYYESVFTISGHQELVDNYGDWYSFKGNPRAKIMNRDHVKINNLRTLMDFMRSNDYRHDPFARCAGCNPPYVASSAIASRYDLIPRNGIFTIPVMRNKPKGAIDAKMTSYSLMKNLNFLAVSGPTTGTGLPIFKWSTSGYKINHFGLPDEWNFQPVMTKWKFN